MTAQAVFEERAAEESGARLSLYAELLSRIRAAWAAQDYDAIWATRDEFTNWAPWLISLPLWEQAFAAAKAVQGASESDAAMPREDFARNLKNESDALAAVLESGTEQPMPNGLLGDISREIEQYTKATSSASLVT